MLNYDALLDTFHHYRLEDVNSWNLRFGWRKLTHVCRKWRYLIYDSPSRLDLHLLLTNGSPTLVSLAHLPPLPLIIDYCHMSTSRVGQDELDILTGLQQRGRVRRISLQVPSPHLGIFLSTIGGLYPILENLSLTTTATEEETSLVLPSTFSARNLRYLELQGVGFPKDLQLFTYFTTLVRLKLTRIQAPYYFHPGHLVTQLQGLLHLEELSIGFAVPIPIPSTEVELLPAPMLRVTLPTLKRLMFRGVAVYLENLVAQINAPLLEGLVVTLFFEFAFTLVSLTQLIDTTGGLRCLSAKVLFKREGVSIVTNNSESLNSQGLIINVNCEQLDWQIDAASQCCEALEHCLSTVEELTLDLDEDGMPSGWDDSLDSMLWHALLVPFSSVKKLQIGSSLTFQLSEALKSGAAESGPSFLPELQKLEVQLEINDTNKGFSTFIETREREGRAVEFLAPHSPSSNLPEGNQGFEQSPDMTGNMNDYAKERGPTPLPFAGRGRTCLKCISVLESLAKHLLCLGTGRRRTNRAEEQVVLQPNLPCILCRRETPPDEHARLSGFCSERHKWEWEGSVLSPVFLRKKR